MTGAQFYKKLEEVGQKMQWIVDEDGRIRGKFKKAKVKRCFCPITGVCYIETRKFYSESYVDLAYDELKLNKDFANSIISASDASYSQSKKVRRHLMKALGVKNK